MKAGCNAPVLFWNRRFFAMTLLFLGLLNLFGCGVKTTDTVKHLRTEAENDTTTDTVKRLRTEAENGDVNAQFDLGRCLAFGDGCKKNPEEAVKWFRMAAEHGQAKAQCCLGLLL
ncbi:MAG: sel1 repeat family protein, partial [Thermoguttaceae bacterium]|nr:sel1 repeat family protein [Thermoguttaceae bacterium]